VKRLQVIIFAGLCIPTHGQFRVFRYTAARGMTDLGDLPSCIDAQAAAVNSSGVITGTACESLGFI